MQPLLMCHVMKHQLPFAFHLLSPLYYLCFFLIFVVSPIQNLKSCFVHLVNQNFIRNILDIQTTLQLEFDVVA